MDKRCGIYTMEYYLAYKKKKGNLKKGNTDYCDNMNELSGCYAKWSELTEKGKILILLKQTNKTKTNS